MQCWSCGGTPSIAKSATPPWSWPEPRQYVDFRTFDTLPMFEEMVVTGVWWDFVDEIATHRLAGAARTIPEGNVAQNEIVES